MKWKGQSVLGPTARADGLDLSMWLVKYLLRSSGWVEAKWFQLTALLRGQSSLRNLKWECQCVWANCNTRWTDLSLGWWIFRLEIIVDEFVICRLIIWYSVGILDRLVYDRPRDTQFLGYPCCTPAMAKV